MVATNDCHYLKQEDAKAHEVLLCIQTQNTINDKYRMSFETDQLYLKSPRGNGPELSNGPPRPWTSRPR